MSPLRRAVAAALLALLAGCDSRSSKVQGFDPGPVPAEFAEGERRYDQSCGPCHGPLGTGTSAGPPFIDRIYEPSHHGDAAFRLAVIRGVRAHHWNFGDMPPVPGMDSAGIADVTGYVRWLQRQAGIE